MITKAYAQGITNPAIDPAFGATTDGSGLASLMASLWMAIISVGGLALLLYLAWGGLEWVIAGGDKGKVENARAKITQGIIGMIILASTVAISIAVSAVLGIDLLNPTFGLEGVGTAGPPVPTPGSTIF